MSRWPCPRRRNFPLGNGQGALWGGLGGAGWVMARSSRKQAEDLAANGWLGAGWSPLDWLGSEVQLDSHTARCMTATSMKSATRR